ncbi:MAG: hypothetical protein ILA34_00430 [Bacteroidaceae bacterium]|nr:hypothetical protein [Bacteroidaceae bacterium]
MPEKECFLRQVGVLPSAAPMLHARREVLDGHIPRKDKEGRASGIGWPTGDHLRGAGSARTGRETPPDAAWEIAGGAQKVDQRGAIVQG